MNHALDFLADRWLASDEAIQLLGDGLLTALAQHVSGAGALAADCDAVDHCFGAPSEPTQQLAQLASQLAQVRSLTSRPAAAQHLHVAKQVTRPIRNREARVTEPHLA